MVSPTLRLAGTCKPDRSQGLAQEESGAEMELPVLVRRALDYYPTLFIFRVPTKMSRALCQVFLANITCVPQRDTGGCRTPESRPGCGSRTGMAGAPCLSGYHCAIITDSLRTLSVMSPQ